MVIDTVIDTVVDIVAGTNGEGGVAAEYLTPVAMLDRQTFGRHLGIDGLHHVIVKKDAHPRDALILATVPTIAYGQQTAIVVNNWSHHYIFITHLSLYHPFLSCFVKDRFTGIFIIFT